ncbi:MAG: 5-formyltetrahydrofolate cyclo-ligase [Elusimicrobia bacterium HGW-Elusimicrobia-2]|nr:MAG: 5-formyltetrahydrofolate cyclo-ligase [Elusimicrobia bacterium HGW-Elusimicrobia-2]
MITAVGRISNTAPLKRKFIKAVRRALRRSLTGYMKLSEKESLRERGRRIRKILPAKAFLSGQICERIMGWDLFVSPRRVMSYCAIDGEVDLGALNIAVPARELYLPAVVPDKSGLAIEPRRFFQGAVCVKGKFGIDEAPEGAPVIKPEELDLILVPGIMFSLAGGRIGFGHGYYDRFLASCAPAVKAGVCFEAQLGEDFEPDKDDVSMDFVITEKKIYEIVKRKEEGK